MTTAMSKRNQARNERALQDLLKNTPGNDRCADCSARNPGWASWSLGIFLCMRCAAIHRKLGTHISKVKSLSMDSWSNDQVEHMKKVGNVNSNRIYNPKGKAPIVPIDQDEVDGAVEWFIKQKYVEKSFQEGARSARIQQIHRNQTFDDNVAIESPRSARFAEDEPSTPTSQTAPKSGKKFSFGLRSASSTFNLGKKNRERKASLPSGQVVGAAIGLKEDGMEWKLVTLKEMGFPDEKRNTEILKGMNGDLERAIESLVRLGQGPSRPGLTKKVSTTFASSASLPQKAQKPAPIPASSSSGFGASVHQSPQSTGFGAQSSTSSPTYKKTSNNPFDALPPHTTQSSQSNIDQAFSNMSISQPMSTQSTGILPSQQAPHQAIYQQSMTPPPMPNMQQQAYGYNPYAQQQPQQVQPLQPQTTGYNPFLQQQQQVPPMPQSNPFMAQQMQPQQTGNPYMQAQQIQPQPTSNPFMQTQQPQNPTSNPFFQQQNTAGAFSTNPQHQQQQGYGGQQAISQSPVQYQQAQNTGYGTQSQQPQMQATYQQHQQQFQPQQQPQDQQHFQQAQSQQQQQNFGYANPFMQQQQQFSQPDNQQQFQQGQFQQQPLVAQPTGRMNKQSILALYGMQPSIPEHPDQQPQIPQRSVTMPAAMSTGSNNPFGATPAAAGAPAQGNARVRDSIFAGTDDPFANLSAKIR